MFGGIFGMTSPVTDHQGSDDGQGESDRYEKHYDGPNGGYTMRVSGNRWEITAHDNEHGTRASFRGTCDSDDYEKHETDQNINRSHQGRHADGAYRAPGDEGRSGSPSIAHDAMSAGAGQYYRNADGNVRRK